MTNVTRHALRVYAALSELRENNGDVLDALVPFFEPILEVMNGKVFNPALFALAVQRVYRWRFTKDIAEHFIPRLLKKQYLVQKAIANNRSVYVVTYTPPSETPQDRSIADIFERLIDDFEKFPATLTDLHEFKKTRDQLKDLLIRFLVSMDAYAEVSFTAELAKQLDKDDKHILSQIEEGGRPLSKVDRYVCARFVQHVCRETPAFIPQLVRLASIGLLTEVVEDFIKPTGRADRANLSIVLDAPLALDLLGCSGKALQNDIISIVEATKAIGCSVVVLPISCEEMSHNLNQMLSLPVPLRHGYTHDAIVKQEVMVEFVRAVARDPERALTQAGVTVRPIGLDDYPNLHPRFSVALHNDFFNSIFWVQDVRPREHDATCLTVVMRMRDGKHSSDLFRSGYIFVTRNPAFAGASRKYCLENRLIHEVQEPPIIHQRELATTAWLRTGLGSGDEIPRQHLLASCDRVLQTRPEVRAAVAARLAKFSTDTLKQFELLLLDSRSVRKLADETLNDEMVVTDDNAQYLLDVMRQASIAQEKDLFDKQLALAHSDLSQAQRDRDAAITSHSEIKAREQVAIQRAIDRVNARMAVIEKSAAWTLALMCVVGAVDYFTKILTGSTLWSSVLFVAGALGVYHLVADLLEKPKIGLSSLLNPVARFLFERRLAALGFERHAIADQFMIDKARVMKKAL